MGATESDQQRIEQELQELHGQALLGRLLDAYNAGAGPEQASVDTLAGTVISFAAGVLAHVWLSGQEAPDPPGWEEWRRLCTRGLGQKMRHVRQHCVCGKHG